MRYVHGWVQAGPGFVHLDSPVAARSCAGVSLWLGDRGAVASVVQTSKVGFSDLLDWVQLFLQADCVSGAAAG